MKARPSGFVLGLLIVAVYGVPMLGVLAVDALCEWQVHHVRLVGTNFNPHASLDTTQVVGIKAVER